jgi:hypothetical protein
MNSTEMMRREILRLARATERGAFISTRRMSAFYHLSEKSVRQELARLADENSIRLAGCCSGEEFVEGAAEGVAVHVEPVDERPR